MALFGVQLPRVPGHEIAGGVDAVGEGVTMWQVGDKVGVGWSGGVDLTCEFCRRGDFTGCVERTIVGASYDGGYAEYMVAPEDAVARVPDELSFEEASPLMCAGITAFNALRHAKAGPGDLVAVQGVGGVPPRGPVREPDGFPHGRDQPRPCEGGARAQPRRRRVHRQRPGQRRRGREEDGRRVRDPRDRRPRRPAVGPDHRPASQRPGDRARGASSRSRSPVTCWRPTG
ncbi:alcohol dehydrogenase catalytic domain-containing protein [Amycolatopsis sp. FDAARGOS 1241]|nr:alcohol dehydrogenase catalytic domain-containing protein [Amycolatopsis sp. FDAARGOS 1241]